VLFRSVAWTAEMDRYLEFVAARARPNSLDAVGFDLKVFFTVLGKAPADITTADVYNFIAAQRGPRQGHGGAAGGQGTGLSARTIKRRLSSVSGLAVRYLTACVSTARSAGKHSSPSVAKPRHGFTARGPEPEPTRVAAPES